MQLFQFYSKKIVINMLQLRKILLSSINVPIKPDLQHKAKSKQNKNNNKIVYKVCILYISCTRSK